MILFIDVFLMIFEETIQFPKTKSQPLLPYQTVIQPNRFRKECKKFIKFYNAKIDFSEITPIKIGNEYQRDCKRSKKIADSFINGFISINNTLKQYKNNKYSIYKPSAMNDYDDYSKYNLNQPPFIINDSNLIQSTKIKQEYDENHGFCPMKRNEPNLKQFSPDTISSVVSNPQSMNDIHNINNINTNNTNYNRPLMRNIHYDQQFAGYRTSINNNQQNNTQIESVLSMSDMVRYNHNRYEHSVINMNNISNNSNNMASNAMKSQTQSSGNSHSVMNMNNASIRSQQQSSGLVFPSHLTLNINNTVYPNINNENLYVNQMNNGNNTNNAINGVTAPMLIRYQIITLDANSRPTVDEKYLFVA